MKTSVKKVSIFSLAATFVVTLLLALFAWVGVPAATSSISASAATSAKITGVAWNSSGYVYLYTNVPTSATVSNINHNAYLPKWRYQNITMNGIAAVDGGLWDNGGYFSDNGDGYYRYTLPFTTSDVANVEAFSDGYKYLNFKMAAGANIGAEYVLGSDFEFTIVFTSNDTFDMVKKTARITQVVSQSNDASYYWYQFHTNVLGSETATNKDHNNYLTPWRTTKMVINGNAVVSGGDFYYAGGFRNDESRRNYNEDGTAGNLYYVYMTGYSKSSINKLTDKKITVELLPGRRLGDEYVFGYQENIVIDYSNGTSEHSLPITGAEVVSHQANAGNSSYEILVNIPGVTDFKPYTNAFISSVRSAIKVDGQELSSEEKNMTYFTGGKLKISGKTDATGAFSAGKIHEVVIPVGTKFESEVTVTVSGTTKFVEGYTNRTLEEEIRVYVYQDKNGEFQVSNSESDINVAYFFDPSQITMVDGASVRMKNPTGLGFTTRIDKAAYEEAIAECGEGNVTVGTLILPTDYLTCDFTIDALNANGIQYKNIVNSGWKNEETIAQDGYYEYRGSLAPVQEYNYDRNFSAVGYLAYTLDGETTYVYTTYSAENNSRSVAFVAEAAYNDLYKPSPDKNTWLRAAADEPNTTISYTEGKGWKISGTTSFYNFYLNASIIDFYLAQGATTLTLTAGGSFDGTSHAGAPVNCQAWIIPKNSSNVDDWNYKAGFISGWTSIGNGKYSHTIDLTSASYKFAGNDLRIRVNSVDVNSNQVGAMYLYGIEFNVEEKDGSGYAYEVFDGTYSPYTAEERKMLETYVPFDSSVNASYKIVKPSAATASETTAANLLQGYLQETMGITVPVVSDSAVSDFSNFSKYISVGQTSLLSLANLDDYAENNVDYDGYIIKTMGSNLFIDGIVDRGTVYGVMDFAEAYLGYMFIDGECYTAGSVASLEIKDVADKAFTPYIETRSYLEYDVTQGYTDAVTAISRKSNNYYVWGVSNYGGANNFGYWGDNAAHTMQATLEKGIELDGGTKNIADYAYTYTTSSYSAGYVTHYQPCLTNATTKSLMANAMKELIKANYANGIRYYTLTQEDSTDNSGYCTCSNCSSARTTYGGQSGVTLKFMNDLVTLMDSDTAFAAQYPDYKLYTYAYNYSFAYPTVSNTVIKACDKVAVMVCPSASNYMKDLFNSANSESKKALEGWHNYCADLMIWMYDANFTNYVEYNPTLTGVIADNVYKLKQLGVSYIMINGAYNADGMWDDKLRAYVYSELLYNFNEAKYRAGADAYVNEIVAEYIAAYYGDYATTVQGIVTALQTAFNEYGKLAANTSSASKIDIAIIQDQISAINSAINANSDATMEKRLYAVKASLLATLYENSKPVIASQWSYKTEFKNACSQAGITQWSETQTITDKFGS